MAMYGPRRLSLDAPARFPGDRSRIEGAQTSRARGAARSAAARDKASRPLTSSASRRGAESRAGSPVPSAGIEDLCERILVELRLQRGPASAVARERLIRLVSNYIGAHAQLFLKTADSGVEDLVNADDSTGLGASALAQDLYAEISGLQVQLAEAQARTAEERSKMARANLRMRQAEENTRLAEERCFRAESRAHRAETRLREVPEFELKFTDASGVASEDESRDMDVTKSRSRVPEQKSRSPTPPKRRPGASSEGEREAGASPKKASAKARSKSKASAKSGKRDKPAITEKEREAAATKIQSLHRGNQGRQEAKKNKSEQAAAAKIQSVHRGNQGRQEAAAKKEERSQQAAAVKIQSAHRGNQGRQEAKELREAKELEEAALLEESKKAEEPKVPELPLKACLKCDNKMHTDANYCSKCGIATQVAEEGEEMIMCLACGGKGRVPKNKKEVVESDSSDTPRLDLTGDLESAAAKEAELQEEQERLARLRQSLAVKRQSMTDTKKQQEEERKKYEEDLAAVKQREADEKARLERQLKEEMDARVLADEEEKKNIKKKYKADMKKQQEEFQRLREKEEKEKQLQKEKYELELQKAQAEQQKERERIAQEQKEAEEKAELEKKKLQEEMEELEREAKQKAQAEEKLKRQLEAQKQEIEEQNRKALELQKTLQEEQQRLEEQRKIAEEMQNLESERVEMHSKQKMDQIKAENAKNLEALQAKTIERNEAAANMFAEQKRQELFQMLQLLAFDAMRECATESKMEKKHAEMEKQMNELQKSYKEKEEFSANRMADKYYQKICEALLKEVLYVWKEDWFSGKQRRREERFQKELEEMQQAERAKGGLQAEKMANKMQQKLLHKLKNRVFVDWNAIIIAELAERKQQDMQQKLEALQAEQREKGDQTADLMAEQAYKTYCLKLTQQCWAAWKEDQRMAAANKKQEELQKQIEENAFRERQRGDAAAEKAADKFARQKLYELFRIVWTEWKEDFMHGKFERMQKGANEELERMKRMKSVAGHDREHDAEIMAEKFHRKIVEEIKHICLGNWHKVARKEKTEREAQKLKEDTAREIEELKKREREKGDANAEMMADKFNKRRIQGWAQRCLGKWLLTVKEGQAEKQQLKQKLEYEEQMAKLKAAEREKGDKTAEAMAENFRKKLERQMVGEVLSAWKMEMVQVRADKVREEEKKKMEADMNKLLAQEREKGDARAQQIAEQNVKKLNYDLKIFAWGVWQSFAKEEKATREQEQVEKELNDLKNKTRQKGDQTANMMAEKFHKKICLEMLQACFTPWIKLAMQSAHEREKERAKAQMDKEIAELKNQERAKGDKTAREMADKFYKKHWNAVLARCAQAWHKDTKMEIAERQAAKLRQEHEDKLAELQAKERQKGDENAELMSQQFFKRIQEDMKRVTLQLVKDFVVAERAEREKLELQHKFEDDMKKLKEQEQENKDASAAQMAERLHKKHQQAMMLRCFAEWTKLSLHGAAERKAAKERQHFDEEIERLRRMEREKGDLTAERIADQRSKKLRHELMTIVLYQWQKMAISGRALREREYFNQQHKRQLDELYALHVEQHEVGGAIAEQMATVNKRKGDQAVSTQIIAVWHHFTANEKARRKREELEREYEDQMHELMGKHRKRGDETAELMAENFYRKHWNERIRRCLATWRTAQLRAVADRNEAEVRREMQDELDRLRRQVRTAGDEKAEHMAGQFDKQHCIHMVHVVLQLWCSYVSEEQFRQQQLKMRREHEQQLAMQLKRAQDQAEIIANFLFRSKLRTMQARCLLHWNRWVRVETEELDNKNRVKVLQEKHEAREMQNVKEFKDKIGQLRERMMSRFIATEGLLSMTRYFCALSFNVENSIRERFMQTHTTQQEDELARMVQVQSHARFRMLSYMGGRMLRHINKLVMQRVMVEWIYVLRIYEKVKQHVAETMLVRHEIEEFKSAQEERAQSLLDKLEAFVGPLRDRRLMRRAVKEWHQTVSSGLNVMKIEEERIKAHHEFDAHREKLMEETAKMVERMQVQVEDAGMRLILQRVLTVWAQDVDKDRLLNLQKADEAELKQEYQDHLHDLEIEKTNLKDHFAEWNAEAMFKVITQLGLVMYFSGWVRCMLRGNTRDKSAAHEDRLYELKQDSRKEIAELKARFKEERVGLGSFFVDGQDLLYYDNLRIRLLLWWKSCTLVKPRQHVEVVRTECKDTRKKGADASLYICERMREEASYAEMSATLAWWLKAIHEAWAEKELKKMKKQVESEVYRAEAKQKDVAHSQMLKLAGYINYRHAKDLMTRMVCVWKGGADVTKIQSKLETSLVNFKVGVREHGRDVGLWVSTAYEDMIQESLTGVILVAWFTVARQVGQAEDTEEAKDKQIDKLQVEINHLGDEVHHYGELLEAGRKSLEKSIDMLYEDMMLMKLMTCWSQWQSLWETGKRERTKKKAVNEAEQRLEERIEEMDRLQNKARLDNVDCAAVLIRRTRLKLYFIRTLAAWQRYIFRAKTDAEISKLTTEGQNEAAEIKEKLGRELEEVRSRVTEARQVMVEKMGDAQDTLLMTNVYRVWQRQWVIAEMDGEQKSVVADLEKQLADAIRAKKAAETKANMTGALFSSASTSAKTAKLSAAKAKADATEAQSAARKAKEDAAEAKREAIKKQQSMGLMPSVKEEADAETPEQFMAIRKQRITTAMMKLVKRRLAIALLGIMEFQGHKAENPPGFDESFSYAREQAQKRKGNAQQQAAHAEKSLKEALDREKEALKKIEILEEENQERERQLTICRKELSAAREKLKMTARGDVATWNPAAPPPVKGDDSAGRDTSPDPTGKAMPLQKSSGQAAPPPKPSAPPAAGSRKSALASPVPAPPGPTRPTGRSDSAKRVSFDGDRPGGERGGNGPGRGAHAAGGVGSGTDPGEVGGVSATLDRLARARQAITGPSVDPDDDDFSWPAGADAHSPPRRQYGDLGGPLTGSASSPLLRVPRPTVAEQAQLAAQLSELQLYMGRFEASHK